MCSLLSLILTIAGNSIHVYNQYLSNWVGTANRSDARHVAFALTSRIDAWQPSTDIITLLFWAGVGVVIVAFYQGLAHTTRRIIYLQRMSSRRLRKQHPWATAVFWKQWALTAIGSFVALGSALFIFCMFVLCIMPIGIVYTRVFVAGPTIFNTFFGLMGVSMLLIGLLLVFVAIRLVYNRRRLVRLA